MEKVITYRYFANLVPMDSDGILIHSYIYLPNVRNCFVSTVLIPLSDCEWHETIEFSTGLGDDILAYTLKIKVVTIKRAVMWISPGPAGTRVQRDAHSFTLYKFALFFGTAVGGSARIYVTQKIQM